MHHLLVVLLTLAAFEGARSALPSYIHVCKRLDPQLEKCIINSVEKLRPKLRKGIPELDVPGLEPLNIPKVDISRGHNFKAVGSNLIVRGASDFKILSLKADAVNLKFDAKLLIPTLVINAIYDVDMRLIVPIKGSGPIHGNATDVLGDAHLKGRLEKRKGKEYFKVDKLDLKLNISNYNVHLENLFNGDKVLGEAVNVALNQNKNEIMSTVAPTVQRVVSEVLLEIAKKITTHFTYDELFPKN